MFSGIIETTSLAQSVFAADQGIELSLERPANFDDIKIGDSIACNGICLTITYFDDDSIAFFIGAETIKITGWTVEALMSLEFNLERSLRLSDRIHGSLVSGHVDATASIADASSQGENLVLTINYPKSLSTYLWQKGSVVLNGVSLTINLIDENKLSVCLIPETLKRTNLKNLTVGSQVNIEADYIAKAVTRREEVKNNELNT